MEGIEVSIINLSYILNASYSARFDSYYFQKEFLKESFENNFYDLSKICIIKSGTTPIERDENLKEGIILLKTDNIRNGILSSSSDINFFYIDEETNKKMKSTELKVNDILINIVGATTDVIGRCSILAQDFPKANITQAMALLRVKKEFLTEFNSYFIFAFLISKYGHKQVRRIARPTGQFNMNLQEVGSLIIPIVTYDFQQKIKEVLLKSERFKSNSIVSYSRAENLLLETIGLNNYEPCSDPINVKSFKKSFLASGRLDAEYYQKKYEDVILKIKSQKHDRLVKLVDIKKSIEPGSDAYSDEGLPFLRVSDYNKFGINEPEKKLSSTYCKKNSVLLNSLKPKKETILFSKDGSVGTAYMLRKDMDLVTSGAILHLTVKDKKLIIPEYLTLALNSKLVQMQAERDAGGSIILHWRKDDIENVIVPVIDYPKQVKIAELVEESFRLKKQSEQLLETAMRAVEIAIEESEEKAIEFINQDKR
ncbi:MAG: restriction endonuclease subunit S [Bacteroidota bacterium]